jgi:hypothetical protein
MNFPWVGMMTIVGNQIVDISRDWTIADPLARRVAGFARSSISIASLMPCLSIVILCRLKHPLLRVVVALVAISTVFLTTQKGALIAFLPIAAILCLPSNNQLPRLRTCFLLFLVLDVALPVLTAGMHPDHGSGVFSTESLYLRIAYTWPESWQWIDRHGLLCFGVGLGGMGGPQRFYAADSADPGDNFFVMMYAYFGIFSLLYFSIIAFLTLRRVSTGMKERATAAVAVVAFIFGYGVVISIIEDQMAPLFFGAALGVLWRETRASAGEPKGATNGAQVAGADSG